MKSINWQQFFEEQEVQNNVNQPVSTGDAENHADKTGDLVAALKEIIETAKKAIETRSQGLAHTDQNNEKKTEFADVITRPSADGSSTPDNNI